MEDIKSIISSFSQDHIFTEDDLYNLMEGKKIESSTLRWTLFHLCEEGVITKVKPKTYIKSNTAKYDYQFISEESKKISQIVQDKYKKIRIAIWDDKILNQWLELLLTQNIVFVEVEKEFSEIIFESLKSQFEGSVLFNPTIEDIFLYQKDNIIVVKDLFSQSPINMNKKRITIEKLIVDLLYEKTLNKLLDSHQIIVVVTEILKQYMINETKLYAYAERKHKKEELRTLIESIRNQNA